MKSPILLLAVATTVIAPLCSAQDFVTVDGNAIHYEIKGSGEPWIVLVTGNGLALNSLDPDVVLGALRAHLGAGSA